MIGSLSVRRFMIGAFAAALPWVGALAADTALAQQGPNPERYEDPSGGTVTICHYDGDRGTTLTLPKSEANAHLDTHQKDTAGACPTTAAASPTPAAPKTGSGVEEDGGLLSNAPLMGALLVVSGALGFAAASRTR